MTLTKLSRLCLTAFALAFMTLSVPVFVPSGNLVAAQTTNGRFVITVKDQTGAVIAGATVTIVNDGTKQQTDGATRESGLFTTPLLPVGNYTISVEAPGFNKTVSENITLNLGQEYGLVVTLQAGGGTDVVEVSGGEALVTATNGELRNTVSEKQTQDLPLLSRNPLQLIQLQAGVNGNLARTNTVINGQRSSSAVVTQDGVNIQDNFIRANALDFSPNRPTVAGVKEVSITTQNAGADVAGSSAIRFVTSSGTNEFHGDVFEFHRNSATAANDFFNNATRPRAIPRPQLIQNQFGVQVGGPVRIPGVYNGKDKFFFFTSYEGFRLRTASQQVNTTLLPDARRGVFTYRDSTGQTRKLDLLGLKKITIDPTVAGLIGRLPSDPANITTAGDGLNTSGLLFQRSTPQDRNTFKMRFDYILNEKHRFEAIYNYAKENVARTDVDTTFNKNLLGFNTGRTHFGVAAWNWTINNQLNNEVRVGHNFTDPKFISNEDRSRGFFVGGLTFTNPEVVFLPQGRSTYYTTIQDQASYTFGKHFFRFGGQFDIIRVAAYNLAGTVPVFNLGQQNFPSGFALTARDFPGGIDATQLLTANNTLAMYAGLISNGNVTYNAATQSSGYTRGAGQVRLPQINQYALYVTDQFRFHPRLTINAGLRYDYIAPLKYADDLALIPDRGDRQTGKSIVLDPNNRVNFVNGFFFNPDRNNFAPNISVAWDIPKLGRQTVLRGGYSIAYVNDEAIRAAENSVLTNPGLSTTVAPPAASFGSGAKLTGAAGFIGGILAPPKFQVPITFAQLAAINPAGAFGIPDPNLRTPYYQQYNVGIEREISKDIVLTARYVGNYSNNLIRGIDYNQVNLNSMGFLDDFIRARSNGFLALARNGVFDPRFNAAIPGSQALTVFPKLAGGGLLTNGTVRGQIQTGEAGALAALYIGNALTGSVPLNQNRNSLAANVLENDGFSSYNGLQIEIRRRFANSKIGTYGFQASYTFSKTLVNTDGTGQTRFEALLDNNQRTLENSRASFDVPHAFKANFVYELPFGAGKTFNPSNKIVNKLVSGYQVGGFYELQTGFPLSIVSLRGTLNRAGRGVNTANSSLTNEQIKDLIGIFKTKDGIFFINPSVIGKDGRAVSPDGQAPFAGQVFFNPGPGQVGSLQRLAFNGPKLFNVNLNIVKRTSITERIGTEFRAEFYNVFNNVNFSYGDLNVNSTTFGRVTATFNQPRIIQFALKVTF
ncbi:MAG: TonB-dependent receptor [Blastocatellia bacterium]|nr:TonB-dependent receptor [Blastocatellia bacterium]